MMAGPFSFCPHGQAALQIATHFATPRPGSPCHDRPAMIDQTLVLLRLSLADGALAEAAGATLLAERLAAEVTFHPDLTTLVQTASGPRRERRMVLSAVALARRLPEVTARLAALCPGAGPLLATRLLPTPQAGALAAQLEPAVET